MRVLLDTNVLLDVLLNRGPWVTESSAVWQAHDEVQIVGHVMACAIADIFYIARRLTELETAHAAVRICLEAFEICTVDHLALEQAQALPGNDFTPACHQALGYLRRHTFTGDFYLAGGTALALQIGHHISTDLDWFSTDRRLLALERDETRRHQLAGHPA